MSEIKVNELEIENAVGKSKRMVMRFIKIIEQVSNKETEDDAFNKSLAIGHNIGHSLLQTKEAIDHDWGERKLEVDAFFCTEEEEKLNLVKNEIADNLLEGLKKLKEYEANKEQKASENNE